MRPRPLYLVVDYARPHIFAATRALCSTKNIRLVVIPGGIICIVQPADVFLFKSLKTRLASMVQEWLGSPDILRTRGGNMRPPCILQCVLWAKGMVCDHGGSSQKVFHRNFSEQKY
jgi:hypothetical protein